MTEFQLTMQEPPAGDGQRLTDADSLVGERIAAVFDFFRESADANLILVTESGNWIVFTVEGGYSCDDSPTLEVARGSYSKPETLADYVSPRDLFAAGVISAAVRDHLEAKDAAAKAAANERRAAILRAELAKLEGGAA